MRKKKRKYEVWNSNYKNLKVLNKKIRINYNNYKNNIREYKMKEKYTKVIYLNQIMNTDEYQCSILQIKNSSSKNKNKLKIILLKSIRFKLKQINKQGFNLISKIKFLILKEHWKTKILKFK